MYVLGAVKIGTTVIEQLESVTVDPGITEMIAGFAGGVDIGMVASIDQRPMVRFTTTQLKDVLDLMGADFLDGLALDDGSNQLKLLFRKQVSGASLEGLTVANSILVTTYLGLLICDSVNAGLTDPATGEFSATLLTADGTTAPVLIEAVAQYSAHVAAPGNVTEMYHRVGVGYLEEQLLTRVQAFRLQTNTEIDVKSEAGSVWPVAASIIRRQPTWEWDTLDASIIAAATDGKVPIGGKAADFTGSRTTAAFLQNIEKGAGVGDPTSNTNHLKFECFEAFVAFSSLDGNPGQNTPVTIRVTPSWDGTDGQLPVKYTAGQISIA